MVHLNKTFSYFRIKLTHRLVRKLIKELKGIEKQSYWKHLVYKQLKNMWKHPNMFRRKWNWYGIYYDKKIVNRYLYVQSDWTIYIGSFDFATNFRTINYKMFDINNIIKLILSDRNI